MLELGLELDAMVLGGVHVQEREIALAQRDQVAARAEVGLGLDRLAGARDREAQLGAMGVHLHRVPVGLRDGVGRGERRVVGIAVDGQVGRERVRLAAALEVGEDAIRARVGERDRRAPRAVGIHHGVQVLEAAPVAAHDDQVHALLVRDLEVAHRAAGTGDREPQRGGLASRERRGDELQAQALVGDRETADRIGGGGHFAVLVVHTPVGLRRRAAVTIRADRSTRDRGHAEHQAEHEREARELAHRCHTRNARNRTAGPATPTGRARVHAGTAS